jgi:hypothetical protein
MERATARSNQMKLLLLLYGMDGPYHILVALFHCRSIDVVQDCMCDAPLFHGLECPRVDALHIVAILY